jgi:Ca2+-binding RTX toxin-like protein
MKNIIKLQDNIEKLNQDKLAELHKNILDARDHAYALEKMVKVPGDISFAINDIRLTLKIPQSLLKKINFLKPVGETIETFRIYIDQFGEKARAIDIRLGGGVSKYVSPDQRRLNNDSFITKAKQSFIGRPEEKAALLGVGIKDLVIGTRVLLETFEGDISVLSIINPQAENNSPLSIIDQISNRIELRTKSMAAANNAAQLSMDQLSQTAIFLNDVVKLTDRAAAEENTIVEAYLSKYDNIALQMNDMLNALELNKHIWDAVSKLKDALNTIKSSVNSVLDPLDFVVDAYSILEPVLDFFSFILAPFQDVFDYAFEKSGLQGFLDDLTSKISNSLADFSSINDLDQVLDDVLDVVLKAISYISGPITALVKYVGEELLDKLSEPVLVVDDSSDLVSSIKFGTADSDFLVGTAGDDALVGGEGNDKLFGYGGIDRAIYTGKIADYIIRKQANGETWTISDSRSDSNATLDGNDTLESVEELIFSDGIIDVASIDGEFISTRSNEWRSATVATSPEQGNIRDSSPYHTVLYSTSGKDYILGDIGLDSIYSGDGDDIIFTKKNTLPSSYYGAGDFVYSGAGDDFIAINSFNDQVEGDSGNDTVSFENFTTQATGIFLGVDGDDNLFRPTTGITMNYSGSEGALGRIYEVENLIGSEMSDVFYGSRDANSMSGRDGNDTIRGLAGNDILIGDAGDDVLIGDRGDDKLEGGSGLDLFVGGFGDDNYNGGSDIDMLLYSNEVGQRSGLPVKFKDRLDEIQFETTGYVSKNYDLPDHIIVGALNDDGSDNAGLVIVEKYDVLGHISGKDTVKSIELFHGTDGDDTFYGSNFISQIMIGDEGNDKYVAGNISTSNEESGIKGDTFYGGAGNDSFVGSAAKEYFYAGTGNDVVYISGSTYLGGDSYQGKNQTNQTNTIDLSESDYAWRISFDSSTSYMVLSGKQNLDPAKEDDEKVFSKTIFENFDLLEHPRQTTSLVGGYARVDSFNKYIGSKFDDIISFGGRFDHGSNRNFITAFGGAGNDVIFGAQTGGAIYGQAGNDLLGTYNGYEIVRNSTFKQKISLFNEDVRTTLDGGGGNDHFIAGDFQETFIGGSGKDWLSYAATTDLGRDGAVTDTSKEGAHIDLTAGTGSFGFAKGDIIREVENLIGSENGDFLSGDNISNWLIGMGGGDTIFGAGGDDILDGKDGADKLVGGLGEDTLSGGLDHDTLEGGLGNDKLAGEEGDDVLNGGSGDDTLLVGIGDDQLDGGAGTDWLFVTGTTNSVVDLSQTAAQNTGYGTDILLNFEHASGGTGVDKLFGTVGDNVLNGNDGNDILEGRDGNDILTGGQGDDTLSGGTGDDTIVGGGGDDTVGFKADRSAATVTDLGNGQVQIASGDGTDVISGVENFAFNDGTVDLATLLGNVSDSGSTTITFVGTESDFIATAFFFDYDNDIPVDIVSNTGTQLVLKNSATGYTSTLTGTGLTFSGAAGEEVPTAGSITSISIVDGDGVAQGTITDINWDLVEFSDALDAIADNDNVAPIADLFSSNGTLIVDGSGATVALNLDDLMGSRVTTLLTQPIDIIGSGGDDSLIGGAGDDTIVGGGGDDTVGFQADRSAATVTDLGNGQVQIASGDGTDVISGVENFAFNDGTVDLATLLGSVSNTTPTAGADALTGTSVVDKMDGLAGDDTIYGGGGNDILYGSAGSDVVSGGAGDDHVYGDAFEVRHALSEANQVFRLYQATFNRAPDATGHKHWTSELFHGESTLADVREGFVGSQEYRNKYANADDATFVKQMYINVLDRDFDQGEVTQTEIDYWTNRVTETFTRADVVNGFAESQQLINNTQQAANKLAVESGSTAWSDDVYRLYQATLARAPDAGGFADWSDRLANGRELTDVISGFTNSTEFKNTYGALADPKDFVKLLYLNVLDRDFDQSEVTQTEIDDWAGRLTDTFTRADIVRGFSQSQEFKNKTAQGVKDWIRDQGTDDQINGGAGDNTLSGGSLADQFVFQKADAGTNTVFDLEAWDYLSFDGFGYSAASDALGHMSQSGSSVVFSDQGTEITFRGFQLDDVTNDMILV